MVGTEFGAVARHAHIQGKLLPNLLIYGTSFASNVNSTGEKEDLDLFDEMDYFYQQFLTLRGKRNQGDNV